MEVFSERQDRSNLHLHVRTVYFRWQHFDEWGKINKIRRIYKYCGAIKIWSPFFIAVTSSPIFRFISLIKFCAANIVRKIWLMKWPCVRYVATLWDELRVKESAVINLLSTCIFRSILHEYSFSHFHWSRSLRKNR